MEIPIYRAGGTARVEVDPSFLGDQVKTRTLKAAVRMYEANQRTGTHSTLTRGGVSRSKGALFRQKGLGRGRVRHPQVPQCRGGGVAHGPLPRDHHYRMPRKALKVALRSALLSKFRDGQAALVDAFDLERPRTKEVGRVLRELGCAESCLVVDRRPGRNLVLSVRNLPRVEVLPVEGLNALDVLRHRNLVFTQEGLDALREAYSDD